MEKSRIKKITDKLLWLNAKDIYAIPNYELSQIIKEQVMGKGRDVIISFKKPKTTND